MTSQPTHGLVARWEAFWFREIPPDLYAVLRVVFGLVGLACVLGVTPVSVYWPLDGITAIPDADGYRGLLLSWGLGTVAGWALFGSLVAAFACMTLGWHSTLAVRACFIGAVTQVLWNRYPLSGANSALMVVLFCLVWAPCGGAPSIDAWRGVPVTASASIWPLRLLRFQVAFIYFSSGLWKFFGETWRDGTAIHYALNLNGYHRFPNTIPTGYEWVGTLSTYGTLFWELGFGLLLLNRVTRVFALVAGVLIHLGIWATLELGPFSLVMMATYVAFFDPVTFSARFSRWLRAGAGSSGTTVSAPIV